MKMPKLILILLLTLALFPWGAYASVISAAASVAAKGQQTEAASQSIALPSAIEAPTAAQANLCHGPALNGSSCHPLSALVPADAQLAPQFRQAVTALAKGFWAVGRAPQPLLAPPRFC